MKGKEWQEMLFPSKVVRISQIATTLTESIRSLGEELVAHGQNNVGDQSGSWHGQTLQTARIHEETRVLGPGREFILFSPKVKSNEFYWMSWRWSNLLLLPSLPANGWWSIAVGISSARTVVADNCLVSFFIVFLMVFFGSASSTLHRPCSKKLAPLPLQSFL